MARGQHGLAGPTGQVTWEQHAEAAIGALLTRGVEPRFLIQWFSLFEVVERGDPLLIGAVTAAIQGLQRPEGLPLGALECCCCRHRWSASAGPALAVRVELLSAPAEHPVVVAGLTCAGCYVRIVRHREAAERALIEGWFPGLAAKSLTVANEEPAR